MRLSLRPEAASCWCTVPYTTASPLDGQGGRSSHETLLEARGRLLLVRGGLLLAALEQQGLHIHHGLQVSSRHGSPSSGGHNLQRFRDGGGHLLIGLGSTNGGLAGGGGVVTGGHPPEEANCLGYIAGVDPFTPDTQSFVIMTSSRMQNLKKFLLLAWLCAVFRLFAYVFVFHPFNLNTVKRKFIKRCSL